MSESTIQDLWTESFGLISLFDDVDKLEKEERLQTAIDAIREQFGFYLPLKGQCTGRSL